jgi:hypothetical protein
MPSVSRVVLLAMTRQTFFKNAIAKRDLGHHLLELSVLRAQVLDLITGGFANRVPCQLLLARFEETLAPPIVKIGSDALTSAQLGDTLLATETVEYDLFFGGKSARFGAEGAA